MGITLRIAWQVALVLVLGWLTYAVRVSFKEQVVRYLCWGLLAAVGGTGLFALAGGLLEGVRVLPSGSMTSGLAFLVRMSGLESQFWPSTWLPTATLPGKMAAALGWVASSAAVAWGLRVAKDRAFGQQLPAFVESDAGGGRIAGPVVEYGTESGGTLFLTVAVAYTKHEDDWRENPEPYAERSVSTFDSWDSEAKFRTSNTIERYVPTSPSVVRVVAEVERHRGGEAHTEEIGLHADHATAPFFLGGTEISELRPGDTITVRGHIEYRANSLQVAPVLVNAWSVPAGGIPEMPAPDSLRGAVLIEVMSLERDSAEERLYGYLRKIDRARSEPGVMLVHEQPGLAIHLLATDGGAAELRVAWEESDVQQRLC